MRTPLRLHTYHLPYAVYMAVGIKHLVRQILHMNSVERSCAGLLDTYAL